jgi:zinc/manganese transport system substrate-binding protein
MLIERRHVIVGILAMPLLAVTAPAQERPRVVASFSILGDLVRVVGGDAVELVTLVGPDQDAHVFEPTPADARALAGAQLVVVNGLGFEGWLERLVRASGFKGKRLVASEGVKTLRMSSSHAGHGGHGGHSGHGHGRGGTDPHVWQDPRRVETMVRNIARGLAAAMPVRAAQFERNADAYVLELRALDAWIEQSLAAIPAARRRIVTSHNAFGYFEDRYKVDFAAPRGVSTESEPSAADIGRIIRQLKRDKIRIIFMENISDPRLVEQIAREGGAQMGGRLYSDALSTAGGPAPSYLQMMRHNVGLLREAMLAE